jgi:Trk K+ transport system NAD-binding subunit
MYIIIAGCGRVGSQLAQFMSYEGHDVVVIDKDPKSFQRLGGTFNGITLAGIAFDEELLREAGIEKADAFVAVTNFDNTNMMAAEIASKIYRVSIVIARLYNPDKEPTYRRMGIDYICGTSLLAERIKEKLLQGEIAIRQERLDVGIHLVEFAIPPEIAEKNASILNDGKRMRLVSLFRAGREIDWNESTLLRQGDRVVVALKKEGWGVLEDLLGKESACQTS